MESMECTNPSIVVIEELSDKEKDVMARNCKPRKRKGLLTIEGPSDNKRLFIEEKVTVMCLDDGFHQENVVGTSVVKIEDAQVAKQVGEQGVQVGEQGEGQGVQVDEQVEDEDVQVGEQGEEEQGDTLFDVPLDFEGDQEGSDEEDSKENSDFVESDYGNDEYNPNFAKYDVIQEAHEVQYEQRTRRQS
ncbi:hypothetical protein D8674_003132 [Pyrus ussuriensis x Pyrus communis]|uniref:Uncharacterized protein n=1 Tax=Pyrus ussuriensis x Pyrus communis TaxID=2448454 RepID=A0A5N5FGP7_9ROSA|nr:hypothetical protein D8674_003132 [Pyrus ussuriensis x Pyrus communis]